MVVFVIIAVILFARDLDALICDKAATICEKSGCFRNYRYDNFGPIDHGKCMSLQSFRFRNSFQNELVKEEFNLKRKYYAKALISQFGTDIERKALDLAEKRWNIRAIFEKCVKSKTINLNPTYQRSFVWDAAKASRLVETVLARRFIPPIVLHKTSKSCYDVVDGKQRLMSLLSFYAGEKAAEYELPTQASELKLKDQLDGEDNPLNGLKFEYLDEAEQEAYGDYDVIVRVIPENADANVVFAIYQDINCGAVDHSVQQIRKAAFSSEYFRLLDELRQLKDFRSIWGSDELDDEEADGEMIMRAFAFSSRDYKGPLIKFLNLEALEMRKQLADSAASDVEEILDSKRKEFKVIVRLILDVFGATAACRKLDIKKGVYESKLCLPLWDSLYKVLHEVLNKTKLYTTTQLTMNSGCIKAAFEEQFQSGEFEKLLTLKSAPIVAQRHKKISEIIDIGMKGIESNQKRFFSRGQQDILRLWERQDGVCTRCGNHIQRDRLFDGSYTHVDHVIPFSKGGETTDENAELLHAVCNRNKGARK
jgi:hypothetical protein